MDAMILVDQPEREIKKLENECSMLRKEDVEKAYLNRAFEVI